MHPTLKRRRDASSELQQLPKRTALHTGFTQRKAAANKTFVSGHTTTAVSAAQQPVRPSASSPAVVPTVHQPVRPALKRQREASSAGEMQPPHKRAQHSAESADPKVIARNVPLLWFSVACRMASGLALDSSHQQINGTPSLS